MGSFRMGMGGLTSAAVSLLPNGTAVPMVGVMTLCALGGLVVLLIGRRSTRYRAREEDLEEEASRTII
jgi:DHA1 family bicyclomycin/chloramphenicol resistance-like MFS transporter